MTINQGNSFIYVCYPRTGTHFIRAWLQECFKTKEIEMGINKYPMPYDTHLPISVIDPKVRNRNFKWGMIRNPFDFYVSWWSMWGKERTFKDWLKWARTERDDLYHKYIDYKQMKKFDIGAATWWYIRLFCDYEKLFELESLDGINLKEESLMDEVLPYENFAVGINLMFRKDLIPLTTEQITLLEKNERPASSTHEPWETYYDNESRKLILHKDRLIFNSYPDYA
jgi:hypothetical protein